MGRCKIVIEGQAREMVRLVGHHRHGQGVPRQIGEQLRDTLVGPGGLIPIAVVIRQKRRKAFADARFGALRAGQRAFH